MYLAQDGVTEVVGPGYEDKRPFVVTLVDPFDFVGLVSGRDKGTRYWEGQGTGGVAAGGKEGAEVKTTTTGVADV